VPLVRINEKLVYFAHVPRCAGSAVENYLTTRFGPLALLDRRHALTEQAARWSQTSPQHIDTETLARLLPASFIDASFAVIRHPAERLRSVFVRHRDIERTLPADADFDDWIAQLPLPGFALDNHTRPMGDFIPEGSEIFALEQGLLPLIAWLDALAGDTDGPRHVDIINSHTQKLATQDHAGGDIPQLSPARVSALAEIYAGDMALGNYPSPPQIQNENNEVADMATGTRTVLLHYHLFKNAGTSLDSILKKHFKDRWMTREFRHKGGNNTGDVEEWIRSTPDATAFSSHTMIGPLPQVEGVRIIPLILLRDPVKRIVSAYKFERQQAVDNWGANLAKSHDLAGYVRTRLDKEGDRQCRNFQTSRLAPFQQGDAPELERALAGLEMIYAQGLVGLVSDFGAFIDSLNTLVQQFEPSFKGEVVRSNVSDKSSTPPDTDVIDLLKQSNLHDAQVLARAETLLRGL